MSLKNTQQDDECKILANAKHGNLVELINDRDNSKRMCNIGILLSPLIIGIPFAYKQCSKNVQIIQKINNINMEWNETYKKCIKKNQYYVNQLQ